MALRILITLCVGPLVFLILSTPAVSAQGHAALETPSFEKVLLNGKPAYRNSRSGKFLPAPPNEDFLTKINDSEKPSSVYDDCWDTHKFFAYPNEPVEWPIYLAFDDSLYAPPINRPMVVTSRYGWRGGKAHHGIDIDLITGDLVMALLPGKVRLVKYVSGMGKTVVVRHENGLETIYGHLSKQFVSVNQMVEKGQALGRGGTTGNARGSHLHLEVRFRGKSINPELLFDFANKGRLVSSDVAVTEYWANPRKHRSTRKSKLKKEVEEEALVRLAPAPVRRDEAPQKSVASSATESPKIEQVMRKRSRIPVLSAPDLGEDKTYVVQPGDTLYSIAKRYKVGVDELLTKNGIGSNFIIKVGQALVVGD